MASHATLEARTEVTIACLELVGWQGSVDSGLRGEVVARNLGGVPGDYWGVQLGD